jgi:L-2,4-diaminobutyrate decarboxylase
MECTKGALATRFYLALRAHGTAIFRDYVTRCFDLARRFAERIRATDDFELLVEPEANIVCFRHVPAGVQDLDAHQERLRQGVIESGAGYLTQADVRGHTWLRCSLMHPLTTDEDLASLLTSLRRESVR